MAKDFDLLEHSNRSSNPSIHDTSNPARRIVLLAMGDPAAIDREVVDLQVVGLDPADLDLIERATAAAQGAVRGALRDRRLIAAAPAGASLTGLEFRLKRPSGF